MSPTRRWLVCLVLGAAALAFLFWPHREQPVYVPSTDPAKAAVAGVVVDAQGHPLAGVGVTWSAAMGSGGWGSTVYGSSGEGVVTDAEGRFELAGLAPGAGFVMIPSSDTAREGATGTCELRAGMVATGLRIAAAEIPAARRLRGRLLQPDGSPATGRTVQARYRSWLGSTWQGLASTGADGTFVMVSPWPSIECELELLDPAGSQPLTRVEVGSQGLELRVGATR